MAKVHEAVETFLQTPELPYGAVRRAAYTILSPFGAEALPAIEAKLAELAPVIAEENGDWDRRKRAEYAAEGLRLAAVRISLEQKRLLTEEQRALIAKELDGVNDKDPDVLEATLALLDPKEREPFFAGEIRCKDYRTLLQLAHLVPSTLQRVLDATAPMECGKYEDRYMTTHASAIDAFGAAAVGPALAAIAKAKNDGATALARGVEKTATAEHAAALVELLGHGAKGVRQSATSTLQRLGPAAKDAITKGAQSKKKAIREACAELLGALSAERSRADELLAQAAPLREAIAARMSEAKTKGYPQYGGVPAELAKEHGALALAAAHEWMRENAEDSYSRGVYNAIAEALKDDADAAWAAVKLFASLPKLSPYSYREFTYRLQYMRKNLDAPLTSVLKGPAFPLRTAAFELLAESKERLDRDLLVAGLSDPSKEIRAKCTELLPAHGAEVAPLVVPLLAEKSGDARLAAAQVLAALKAPAASEALAAALAKEKKADVAAAMEQAIAACGAPAGAKGAPASAAASAADDTEASITATLAKERKAKPPKWLDLAALPKLSLASGKPLEGDALAGLVTRLMNEGPDLQDPLARRARRFLDDASACAFSVALKDAWAANKGEAKHKWCIYQQAIMADEERLNVFAPRLDEATSGGQHHLAGWYIEVLERHGSSSPRATNVGLSWVAYWAKAAETRSLREKAVAALERAATARGKTIAELEPELNGYVADDVADTQIPTVALPTTIDFGPRSFTLDVGPDLELVVKDASGAPLEKLPAPNKKDDADKAKAAKEEHARLKKQLAAVARAQKERLEQAMVSGRPWTKRAFEKLFLEHPLMKRLGASFVFSTGKRTFRPDDGKLLDAKLEPVTLPDDAVIRLVHRHELDDAAARAWGDFFAEAKLIQPFEQIGRVVHPRGDSVPPPERKLPPATLSGRLRGNGWRHSSVEDAGMCYQAYRAFPGRKVRAHLSHGGVHVADPGWSSDPVGIEGVWFTDLSGNDIDPSKVDPIVFSEVVRDLEHITE